MLIIAIFLGLSMVRLCGSESNSTSPLLSLTSDMQVRHPETVSITSFGDSHLPFNIVCYYYAVEAWYRTNRGMVTPEDIDPYLCTHIHYAYASLNSESLLLQPADEWAEINNKFYERVISLREINPNLKIVLSLGGWTESSGKFASLVAEKYNRKAFIDHAVTFLKLYRFDGLDIAWFFPVCWHGDCDDSDFAKMSDLENFAEFLRELRKAFDQSDSRLILTATVTGDPLIARRCYDFTALAELNYVNVMTFDYSAYWQEKTGHQAPLFSEKNHFPEQDVNNTIHFYIRKGIPRWKIILGIPAFGRSFTLADSHDHGLQSPVVGPGRVGEFTAAEGLLAFYEICDRFQRKGWIMEKDEHELSTEFFAYNKNQWVSFDHPLSVISKSEYAKDNRLGGVMVWDIDRDDFTGSCYGKKFPILSAVNAVLKGEFTGDPRNSD